jgi:DNA (cytosine-5)-methyltransferase 1
MAMNDLNRQQTTTRTTVELFAGAGGLALGLKLSGYCCRVAIESDKLTCETLRANWVNDESDLQTSPIIYEGDARNVDYREISRQVGKIDGVVGGPPCQPFSLGGVAQGGKNSEFSRFVLFLWSVVGDYVANRQRCAS